MKQFDLPEARQHRPSLRDDLPEPVPVQTDATKKAPSLRELPIEIAADFDEPLPELWESLVD
ncbi:MAG: hypothetical protein ABUT39_23270 [Acidobacteriota bacterium]